MPTTQEITNAQQTASGSQSLANDYISGAGNIDSLLKKALGDAYSANQDIVKPLDEATSTYLSSPSVAREKYQNIFNPFTREKLVSQYTQNQATPMLTLSNLLGSRMGTTADIINAGTGAYNAQASSAQNKAALDRQNYQDLLKQFNEDRQYSLDQQKASGSNGLTLNQMLTNLRAFDPTAAQQSEAQTANNALSSIKTITTADKKDLGVASRLASDNVVVRTLANMSATPQQRELSRAMDTLRNTIRLKFTGAAFSPTELQTYSRITGSDPFSTFLDPNSSQAAAQELENYFSGIQGLGQNPYQSQLNALMQGIVGERPPLSSFEE